MTQEQIHAEDSWALGVVFDIEQVCPEIVLTFHPKSFPVRWNQCSATADFCTNYLATRPLFEPISDAISYVLNELIENAVKFSEGDSVQILLGRDGDDCVIVVENHVARPRVDPLRTTFQSLLVDDPLEIMMQRVEENAENPEREGSGLGFLTMMTDYQTRIGWRLTQPLGNDLLPRLTTMARLDLSQG